MGYTATRKDMQNNRKITVKSPIRGREGRKNLLKHGKLWLQLENPQFFHQCKIQYIPCQFSHLCILLPKPDYQVNEAAENMTNNIDHCSKITYQ